MPDLAAARRALLASAVLVIAVPAAADVEIAADKASGVTEIKVGEKLTVALETNAGIPYFWRYVQVDPAILSFAGDDYEAIVQPGMEGQIITGGPVLHRFHFTGTTAGCSTLNFMLVSVAGDGDPADDVAPLPIRPEGEPADPMENTADPDDWKVTGAEIAESYDIAVCVK